MVFVFDDLDNAAGTRPEAGDAFFVETTDAGAEVQGGEFVYADPMALPETLLQALTGLTDQAGAPRWYVRFPHGFYSLTDISRKDGMAILTLRQVRSCVSRIEVSFSGEAPERFEGVLSSERGEAGQIVLERNQCRVEERDGETVWCWEAGPDSQINCLPVVPGGTGPGVFHPLGEVRLTGVPSGFRITAAEYLLYRYETETTVLKLSAVREAEPLTVNVKAQKVFQGRALTGGDFTFALLVNGEERMRTANSADGSISFSPLVLEKTGEYRIEVKEIPGEEKNVLYDTSVLERVLEVSEKGGRLVGSWKDDSLRG